MKVRPEFIFSLGIRTLPPDTTLYLPQPDGVKLERELAKARFKKTGRTQEIRKLLIRARETVHTREVCKNYQIWSQLVHARK